jgi:hypothetical protein
MDGWHLPDCSEHLYGLLWVFCLALRALLGEGIL